MSSEEEVQAALLVLGPALVISIILLLIYWIRKDKKNLERERQQALVDTLDSPRVNKTIWSQQHSDFLQLLSWSKQLKAAVAEPENFNAIGVQLAYEIEERADRINGLTMADRNRILELIEEGDLKALRVDSIL